MTTEDYLAIGSNTLITDDHETLLRQVHPQFLIDGVPSKQAFIATEQHEYLLSTKRERFGAERAYEAHAAIPLPTCGTWGFTVGEAKEAELPSVDDAEHVGSEDHASVSYLDHDSQGKRAQRARKLKDAARCMYQPAPPSTTASTANASPAM